MSEKEIALLERVLLKLALCENDKFQDCVSQFLIPVLNKLSSPHQETLKKVRCNLDGCLVDGLPPASFIPLLTFSKAEMQCRA